MIPKSMSSTRIGDGHRFSESDHAQRKSVCRRAPQFRIALRIDPVGALGRGGKEDALLAAEGAPQLRAREQRGEPRLVAGGDKAEAIERTRHHPVVNQLQPAVTERARELEAQLLELARDVQAVAP